MPGIGIGIGIGFGGSSDDYFARQWYGVEIDEANTSPDLTRIASDMRCHAELPVHKLIRGCLLRDNGTVNYYLDSTDWTKQVGGAASALDGSAGQVMMEWPAFYYKVDMDGGGAGKHQIKISLSALTGYTLVAKHYVSAFEAAIQRSTTKLASVINTATDYRGGNNTSAWDAAANSLLGMACSYINRTDGRTAARNRGAGWNQYGYSDHTWMYWFYVIEFATLNSQKAVNAVLTAEGYKQGGLGAGTTTAASATWNTFNTYNPFIPVGASNSLASGSGEVAYTKNDFGGAGVHVAFKVPRYRGHEHPFGHLWKTVDGVNIEVQSVAGGGKTNTYVADNPANWNDANYTNYINHGEQARADGYQKTALLGATADFVSTVTSGGSDSTYYCDYYYTDIPAATTLRALFVGGAANGTSFAGVTNSSVQDVPSIASARIGFRLSYHTP
ncbi:MAG: hypothetical protein WC365_10420 [Candidatus Babeliales bacterium]|jgi:hypothetical protein